MGMSNALWLQDAINRRVFLGGAGGGLGYAALAGLMQQGTAGAAAAGGPPAPPGWLPRAHLLYLYFFLCRTRSLPLLYLPHCLLCCFWLCRNPPWHCKSSLH